MAVAIIGGTGFLGTAIAKALVARGETPVQVARLTSPYEVVTGSITAAADRADQPALEAIFAEHGVTRVIDVLTLSLENTRALLAATAAAGARYVMISAIDVYANYGGLMGMETPPVVKRPSREDDPVRTALYPYRGNPRRPKGFDDALIDDYDKVPIEAAAREDARLDATILRLPAIYGPGDKQGRFTWITEALAAGGPIRMDERAAAWPQTFITLDDAAAAVALAATSDCGGETFNIAPPIQRTMGEWAALFARLAGRDGAVELMPPGSGGLMQERAEVTNMAYPLTMDGARFEARFGPVQQRPEEEVLRSLLP
ncbi:NAD-dependent epimerase/dehydratase family protein [Pseudoroseicyclus tamaricis]|uniref:NAD-dependent epimerase/dehydratase family protein n=1 Tax=Pseudoroseicyclus tamaricis TaxID=2705421 RepID=A0A6B2JV84_9RHOB|nr:NAD-dependent epimerase/dehydratase family protein [Pseudoroseicyclus tamaricis]NDV00539.1 NAD-dependent epimerase/dehydratase family protein [Pseudoroseicyclus tamaricis]